MFNLKLQCNAFIELSQTRHTKVNQQIPYYHCSLCNQSAVLYFSRSPDDGLNGPKLAVK